MIRLLDYFSGSAVKLEYYASNMCGKKHSKPGDDTYCHTERSELRKSSVFLIRSHLHDIKAIIL